jgi:hypothetical protein
MNAQPIEILREQFKDNWLVIRVTKTDRLNQPVAGEVLFHSPDRGAVWEYQQGLQDDIYITFAGPIVPEGRIVILGHDSV